MGTKTEAQQVRMQCSAEMIRTADIRKQTREEFYASSHVQCRGAGEFTVVVGQDATRYGPLCRKCAKVSVNAYDKSVKVEVVPATAADAKSAQKWLRRSRLDRNMLYAMAVGSGAVAAVQP